MRLVHGMGRCRIRFVKNLLGYIFGSRVGSFDDQAAYQKRVNEELMQGGVFHLNVFHSKKLYLKSAKDFMVLSWNFYIYVTPESMGSYV